MNRQLKTSLTALTDYTVHQHRIHHCPNCQCVSPHSRPNSPIIIRPVSPPSPVLRPNIYLRKSPHLDRSISSNHSRRQTNSPNNRLIKPITGNTKINIRYISPQRNIKTGQIVNKSPQNIDRKIVAPQMLFTFKQSIDTQFQQQPKKPSILMKTKVKQKRSHHKSPKMYINQQRSTRQQTSPKSSYIYTTPNTQQLQQNPPTLINIFNDDAQVAQSIIKQLKLNYDYYSVHDISDISADVSL